MILKSGEMAEIAVALVLLLRIRSIKQLPPAHSMGRASECWKICKYCNRATVLACSVNTDTFGALLLLPPSLSAHSRSSVDS